MAYKCLQSEKYQKHLQNGFSLMTPPSMFNCTRRTLSIGVFYSDGWSLPSTAEQKQGTWADTRVVLQVLISRALMLLKRRANGRSKITIKRFEAIQVNNLNG